MILLGDRLGTAVASRGPCAAGKDKRRDNNKRMLTIAWNPNGFHLIDAMPKEQNDNARYYIDNTLTPVCQ
jgi:hypothetical protein